MTSKYMPIKISKADIAFGGRAMEIIPKMKDIPEEFHSGRNEWVRWQRDWFYSGLRRYPVARDGIDLDDAMSNLAAVQGSFQPKHEHKEAGVAYLASLWFSSPEGEEVKA